MEVFQKFSIKTEKYSDLFVSYSRHPNCSGRIHSLSYWAPSVISGQTKMRAYEEELSKADIENIHRTAAELWDEYFTVPNVKCASKWLGQ